MVKSLRWRSLLARPDGLSAREAYRIFHVAILLNNLLPFRLGDGARILPGRLRPAATIQQAIVALVAERLVDGLLLVGLVIAVVPLFAGETADDDAFAPGLPPADPRLLAGVAAALLVAAALAWWGRRIAPRIAARARERWRALAVDVRLVAGMGAPRLARLGAWTLVAWSGTAAMHYLVLGATGVEVSVLLALAVMLATNFSMLVPAAPANLGVYHAAAAAPLLAAGVAPEAAVASALLLHAVNVLPPALVGAASLLVQQRADDAQARAVEGVRAAH